MAKAHARLAFRVEGDWWVAYYAKPEGLMALALRVTLRYTAIHEAAKAGTACGRAD